MNPLVIVGYSGKMALALREECLEAKLPFKVLSNNAPPELRWKAGDPARGFIDFSTPELAKTISKVAEDASRPWICGTTGWNSDSQKNDLARQASKKIPVVMDSNFSTGIELLCKAAESSAKLLEPETILIYDLHHRHKKDSPSGTSLKIEARLSQAAPRARVQHLSARAGEVVGEHQVVFACGHETLEITHRATSRRIFAAGALRALLWAETKGPGVFQMKDVLP